MRVREIGRVSGWECAQKCKNFTNISSVKHFTQICLIVVWLMNIFYFWPNILLQNKHCKMWNYFLKIFYFEINGVLITNISLSNNSLCFLFIKIFTYVIFKINKSILFFIFYVHYIRSLLKLKYIIFLVISKKLIINKVFFFFCLVE